MLSLAWRLTGSAMRQREVGEHDAMSAHLPTGVGPAPAPAHALPARGLVPASLEILGFRGYLVNDVECILPPICFVAGGVFTMGADLKPGEVYARGTQPSFRLDVAEYSIGQYPVTVAEYACAVRAGAVRQPPVWEFGERRPDWTQQLDGMDHPVVAAPGMTRRPTRSGYRNSSVSRGVCRARRSGRRWRAGTL